MESRPSDVRSHLERMLCQLAVLMGNGHTSQGDIEDEHDTIGALEGNT
jgi:hypothetical protein